MRRFIRRLFTGMPTACETASVFPRPAFSTLAFADGRFRRLFRTHCLLSFQFRLADVLTCKPLLVDRDFLGLLLLLDRRVRQAGKRHLEVDGFEIRHRLMHLPFSFTLTVS